MGSPECIRANLRGFEVAHLDLALLFTYVDSPVKGALPEFDDAEVNPLPARG